MANLTPKQQRFADEYLVDLNATQAAIRAGYSKKTASRIAIELLHKTHVAEYVQKRQAKLQQKTEASQERVIEELAKISFANITDYLEYEMANNWPTIHVKNSTEVDGGPIQEVSISKDGTFKFKLYSKLDALEKLARHLGLYGETADETALDRLDKLIEGINGAAKR